jgi:hypothetical protein
MSGKFKVHEQYRTNQLSSVKSSISIEAHYSDGRSSRVYENVHFPDKFVKKMFKSNDLVDYVIVKDSSDSSQKIIKRSSH